MAEVFAKDESAGASLESRVELDAPCTLHAMVGPQHLCPLVKLNRLKG